MALVDSPFARDESLPGRLAKRDGEGLRAAAAVRMAPGKILPAATAATLVAEFGLAGTEELILHLLPLAREIARPPISSFHVGAVGLATSGEVIFGGNLEWPGAHLGLTLHGEGFVAIRAFHLGLTLETLALTEAHPCAHCRQCLAEFAAAPQMILIDPHGHRLRLSNLYPWPFAPATLGEPGAEPGARVPVSIASPAPDAVEALLMAEAGRAHAPYSGCPAALVLQSPVGLTLGVAIESVAFNPTIQPVMSALVGLIADDGAPAQVSAAWLLQRGGDVDYAASTREMLAAIAPGAELTVLSWRT